MLYEAAAIDGVGPFQRFRYVTFPMLSPATLVASVTAFIGAFEIFTWPYVITNGGPGNATLTIMVYIYRVSFRNLQLGYGAAISIVNLVVLVALVALVGMTWRLWRARAARRWRAALDAAYARHEQAKRTHSGRNVPARTQLQRSDNS